MLESEGVSSEPSALALHRNDFLVKAMEPALKERFDRPEWEVLQYLLIDGRFQGAVYGKFKNGPFLVEDVWAEEPVRHRKEELLRAVWEANPAPESRRSGTAGKHYRRSDR